MCKAFRQRSIRARIKLFSSISAITSNTSLNSNELLHQSVSIYASCQTNTSQPNYHHNTHTYRLKIVKDQSLIVFVSAALPFREVRILQNLQIASTLIFEMVAGAGFEPTTFGL